MSENFKDALQTNLIILVDNINTVAVARQLYANKIITDAQRQEILVQNTAIL